MSESWVFWAFLSALFAAVTNLLAKAGISGISSDFGTLIRTLVALPAMALVVWATGELRQPADWTLRSMLLLGFSGLATAASWLAFFRALSLGQASQVVSVDKLSVVLVALFGVALLGEKLTAINWLGILLVAGGTILVAIH
ncbi:MAG: EamA family transporter [Anaerolineales bacterium]|nr:EamA family transporter [Anaerolineales bacterium]MCW5856344.1 EamA family transporter [Anaerolineales bacterium]MCW5878420.1 EamA family transporter [Anaerolineales bacterium]